MAMANETLPGFETTVGIGTVDPSAGGGGAPPNAGQPNRRIFNQGADEEIVRFPGSPQSVRDAWVNWLAPNFTGNAAYITGTYSDEYGFPHGLMKARNVHKDVRNWLKVIDLKDAHFICGVEEHRYRDILHWHGIIAGDFGDLERLILKASWESERGHCRVLPVLDGCASYITKYALKNDTDNFDWRLS